MNKSLALTTLLLSRTLRFAFILLSASSALGGTYEEWKGTKFDTTQSGDLQISGPDADPDGDGHVNLIEYAFGGEPLSPDLAGFFLTELNGSSLKISFPRRRNAEDLSYSTKGKADMTGVWLGGSDHVNWIAIQGGEEFDTITVGDKLPPVIHPKSFLRLEVTLLPPGGTIPAPHSLSLLSLSPYEVRLFWKLSSQDATQILVERQFAGSPDWFPLALLSPLSTTFEDAGLSSGAGYFYRVSALNSAQVSPVSGSVSVSTPADLDNDGLPDADESAAGSDPANADSDGDGIPDGTEVAAGTNPNSADSDGDGVGDKDDIYATDPLRSRPISFSTYSSFDFSAYDPNPTLPYWMALNDNFEISYGGDAGSLWRSFAWKPDGTTQIALQPFEQIEQTTQGEVIKQFEASGVTPRGTLFGVVSYNTGGKAVFERMTDTASPALYPVPNHPYPYTLSIFSDSDSGPMHGYIYDYFYVPEPEGFMEKTFTGSTSDIQMDRHKIHIHGTSLDGWMVGVEHPPEDPQTGIFPPPIPWLWDGARIQLPQAALSPIGVNDSLEIIGGSGSTAYYYKDGAFTLFSDMIPPVFRGQLSGIQPLHIGNHNSFSSFPVIGFSAHSLEGAPPGEWIHRRFLLQKDSEGEFVISQQVAHEGPVIAPQQINKAASATAVVVQKPRVMAQVDWRFRGIDGYWKGFDPMMPGDLHPPNGTEDGPSTEPSKFPGFARDGRYWASVTMGKENTSIKVWFKDLEFGKKSKLVLAPGSSQFIDISPKDVPLVPTPEDGTDTTQPGFFVPITITGKAASSTKPEIATIELRSTDPQNQLLGKLTVRVFPEVVVDVAFHWVSAGPPLPSGAPHPTSHVGVLIGRDNNGDFIQKLNDVFQQAGVRFERNQQASGEKVVAYDLNGDGQLNSNLDSDPEMKVLMNDPSLGGAKLNIVFIRKPLKNDTAYRGHKITAGWAPVVDIDGQLIGNKIYILTDWAGNNADTFRLVSDVVNHEVGHAFGLSTKLSYLPGQVMQNDRYHHDFGIFPIGSLPYVPAHIATPDIINRGLMYYRTSSNRWMRHEDWFMANKRARERFKK